MDPHAAEVSQTALDGAKWLRRAVVLLYLSLLAMVVDRFALLLVEPLWPFGVGEWINTAQIAVLFFAIYFAARAHNWARWLLTFLFVIGISERLYDLGAELNRFSSSLNGGWHALIGGEIRIFFLTIWLGLQPGIDILQAVGIGLLFSKPINAYFSGPAGVPASRNLKIGLMGALCLYLAWFGYRQWVAYDFRNNDLSTLASRGEILRIRELIEQGDNSDKLRAEGGEALLMASSRGRSEVVEYLLSREVDPSFVSEGLFGRTPLHLAAEEGHAQIVQQLLAAGAKVDLEDTSARTALFEAIAYGHLDIAEMLIEAGADPDVVDESGWTPLMRATCDGNEDAVRLLLRAGANPDLKGHGQNSARDLAKQGRGKDVEELLETAPSQSVPDAR